MYFSGKASEHYVSVEYIIHKLEKKSFFLNNHFI